MPATRGGVLYPFDLSLADWPERAQRAGLTTIGLHAARRFDVLRDFIPGADGRRFLAQCEKLGIAVEFELHAMGERLSRELYYKDPTLFRLDEQGRRNVDANCCPHSAAALDIIAAKAVEWARVLAPATRRYFYWPDDGAQWRPRSRNLRLESAPFPTDLPLFISGSDREGRGMA